MPPVLLFLGPFFIFGLLSPPPSPIFEHPAGMFEIYNNFSEKIVKSTMFRKVCNILYSDIKGSSLFLATYWYIELELPT